MQVIEPPWTDEQIEALRKRNARRVREAIEALGPAYVLYKRPAEPVRIELRCDMSHLLHGLARIDGVVNTVTHSRP